MREPTLPSNVSLSTFVWLVVAFVAGALTTALLGGDVARSDALGAPLVAPPELRVEVLLTPADRDDQLVLVQHRGALHGGRRRVRNVALPSGAVRRGESVERTVARVLHDDCGIVLSEPRAVCEQFHVYSDPERDDRGITTSIVFACTLPVECYCFACSCRLADVEISISQHQMLSRSRQTVKSCALQSMLTQCN